MKKRNGFWYKQLRIAGLAWRSLRNNKFRSFLTSLGIIIGAATIILVIGLGKGAGEKIEAQYSNMSVTTILINAPSTEGQPSKLDITDIGKLMESEHILKAVPQLTGRVEVSGGENSFQAGVLGTSMDFFSMANMEMHKGRMFTQAEEDNHEKVVIIGATVAEELYGSRESDVVGEQIVIGKKPFEIIGVARYKGGSIGPVTVDDSVIMPYDSSYRYVLGKNGRFNINLEARDVDSIEVAMEDAGKILRESHNIGSGMMEDFRLRDMGANVQAAKDSARTMSFLLGSVGFIVLLVGGIGIMNIMHIIVKERTKEIGIRKAIGAKKYHILLQFLLEAVILSFFGAAVGLILATVIFFILKNYGLDIVLVWWSYGVSLVFTVGIGVFFGYYPAVKASQLKPVDTLRYE
ncbi:MAG: ABC transporter permease [Candidatus Moranbacteria bacterium]|nr:ABC transporter permease [Candidatus Moranbacteria bacterium]